MAPRYTHDKLAILAGVVGFAPWWLDEPMADLVPPDVVEVFEQVQEITAKIEKMRLPYVLAAHLKPRGKE